MKHKIYLIVILFFIPTIISFAQCKGCKYFVHPDSVAIVSIEGDLMPNLLPGDTICLNPGKYFQLYIHKIKGSAEKPIIIKNYNGEVIIENNSNFGITFSDCAYIKFTGSGKSDLYYGFKITNVQQGSGLSINYLSSDIEVERVEISNIAFSGIVVKTDPDCSFTSLRDKFTLYNTFIHDNYIHDTGNEGMYIGSSFYRGYTLHCNGIDTTVLPHILSGVKIYNNRIERTGWDAIQVGSASANCKIYNNYVSNDSYAGYPDQMSGILIGGGSKCDCYNNIIVNGKGDGIEVLGLGDFKIFNNLIINAGRSYYPNNPPTEHPKHGIFCKDIVTTQGKGYGFFNNTIVNPKTHGILFKNAVSSGNKMYNNIVVNPGALAFKVNSAYIKLDVPNGMVDTSHNFFSPSSYSFCFDDTLTNNYDLQIASPLINKGLNITNEGVTFDLLNRQRPFGTAFDAGAYECWKNGAGTLEQIGNGIVKMFPNPASDYLFVSYTITTTIPIRIYIVDTFGKVVREITHKKPLNGSYQDVFSLRNLPCGTYFLVLSTSKEIISRKTIVKN
ncbi:MAG: right-handed parallel beta-helix repeat-containing protein [Lentimicrobiaceae bacterium]|nr:right-handed parallel beta-helix repeat-containing protein [Lentimicrobiaceae bacterium]